MSATVVTVLLTIGAIGGIIVALFGFMYGLAAYMADDGEGSREGGVQALWTLIAGCVIFVGCISVGIYRWFS